MPLSFHIKNLDSNKIKLPRQKIKNILQNLGEENFPKDTEFLSNIELININFETPELKNINF